MAVDAHHGLGSSRRPVGHTRAAVPTVVVAFAALLGALALWFAAPARAEQAALLSLEPATADIVVGEEVTLTVRVREVTNLYGIDLRLAFDPAVLEVADVDPAKEGIQSVPGSYPYPDLVARNEADNDAGTIWYMVTQLGARGAASGEGTVVTIHLRGKAPGTGTVGVRQADLANNEGFMIPVRAEECTITVAEASAVAGSLPHAAAAGAVAVAAAGALLFSRRRRAA